MSSEVQNPNDCVLRCDTLKKKKKHSKGLKTKGQLCVLRFIDFDFYYCSDYWVLNIRIELNSVFNIRKPVILYFLNDIIRLQQRNEKNSVKPADIIIKDAFRQKCTNLSFLGPVYMEVGDPG